MSQLSDIHSLDELTDISESMPDELLHENNYQTLVDNNKKLNIIESEHSESVKSTREEKADEFLRNFFIKFGMKKTLDNFMQEWFELKTDQELKPTNEDLPEIPVIYRENQELSDEIAFLQ